jgi:hypothetical protein
VPVYVVEIVVKSLKILLGLSAAAMVCASGVAHAAHVGVFIGGGGYYYPWGVPYYYPYPPAVAVPVPVPAQPQEYVEQGQTSAAPAASGQPGGTWYYCDDTRSYYPYVKSCSSGWRPVPAQQSQ